MHIHTLIHIQGQLSIANLPFFRGGWKPKNPEEIHTDSNLSAAPNQGSWNCEAAVLLCRSASISSFSFVFMSLSQKHQLLLLKPHRPVVHTLSRVLTSTPKAGPIILSRTRTYGCDANLSSHDNKPIFTLYSLYYTLRIYL